MDQALQLQLDRAQQAWDLDLHDRALFLLETLIADNPKEILLPFTRIKWLLSQSRWEDAAQRALELWQIQPEKIVGDVLAIANRHLIAEYKSLKLNRTAVSSHIMHVVAETYAREVLQEGAILQSQESQAVNPTIWQCWFQGLEQAPPLVQACVDSVRRHMPHYKHILLTDENIGGFVQLPESMLNNARNGVLDRAHLADLLRTHILHQYGGIWIDTTVLLSAPIPEPICNAPYFVFRSDNLEVISNWFIVSRPHHPLAHMMHLLLDHYWGRNEAAIYYFLYHALFRAGIRFSPQAQEHYKSIPHISRTLPHRVFELSLAKGDPTEIRAAYEAVFAHKLSHKYPIDLAQLDAIVTVC